MVDAAVVTNEGGDGLTVSNCVATAKIGEPRPPCRSSRIKPIDILGI
jgi:hypothetical protein